MPHGSRHEAVNQKAVVRSYGFSQPNFTNKQFKDMKNRFVSDPILVKIKENNKHINVGPLIEAMGAFGKGKYKDYKMSDLRQIIDDSIRYINVRDSSEAKRENPEVVEYLNFQLYYLLDMFEAMENF